MPQNKSSYLDPLVLAQIGSLELRARLIVEGLLSGLHHAQGKGQSLEFAMHRKYSAGDELKYMDWKVYARTDRFFIKQFEEESNMRVYLLLDASGSMSFKGKESALSKFDYAATCLASLAYVALKQGDSVGLNIFNRSKNHLIPPRHSFSHLTVLLNELHKTRVEGETSLSDHLVQLAMLLKKRSLVILFSDLFDDTAQMLRALKLLRLKKHQLMVFHLLDQEEKDFNYSGNIRFKSMENEESIVLEPHLFKSRYQKALQEWIENYRLSLRNANIHYHFQTTSQNIGHALGSVLSH